MDTQEILALRAIPGTAPERIADEADAFLGLRGWDPERAAMRAQRFADFVSQFVFERNIGPAGARDPKALVASLDRENIVPAEIAESIRAAHEIGVLASERAMNFGIERTVSPQEIGACDEAVDRVVRWLIDNANTFRHVKDVGETTIISGIDLTLDDVYGTIDVDREAYGDCDATYIPSRELVRSWYEWNPDIYTVLEVEDTKEVVGYINAMPVSREVFGRVLSGHFQEDEFGTEHIVRYDSPGYYYLYFCSVALKRDWRSQGHFRRLLDGFASKLGRLAHRSIFVREMVADAVTPAGRHLCESFGMDPVGKSERESAIYRTSLIPPRFRPATRNAKRMHSFYYALSERLEGGAARACGQA